MFANIDKKPENQPFHPQLNVLFMHDLSDIRGTWLKLAIFDKRIGIVFLLTQ